jgi:hypothetical protein
MIGTAWKPMRVRVGKAMLDVQRAFATRLLATKWQWSHARVVRYLTRLETTRWWVRKRRS